MTVAGPIETAGGEIVPSRYGSARSSLWTSLRYLRLDRLDFSYLHRGQIVSAEQATRRRAVGSLKLYEIMPCLTAKRSLNCQACCGALLKRDVALITIILQLVEVSMAALLCVNGREAASIFIQRFGAEYLDSADFVALLRREVPQDAQELISNALNRPQTDASILALVRQVEEGDYDPIGEVDQEHMPSEIASVALSLVDESARPLALEGVAGSGIALSLAGFALVVIAAKIKSRKTDCESELSVEFYNLSDSAWKAIDRLLSRLTVSYEGSEGSSASRSKDERESDS